MPGNSVTNWAHRRIAPDLHYTRRRGNSLRAICSKYHRSRKLGVHGKPVSDTGAQLAGSLGVQSLEQCLAPPTYIALVARAAACGRSAIDSSTPSTFESLRGVTGVQVAANSKRRSACDVESGEIDEAVEDLHEDMAQRDEAYLDQLLILYNHPLGRWYGCAHLNQTAETVGK